MKLVILAVLLGASLAQAQGALEFEVASVKPNKSRNGYSGGCRGIDSRLIPGPGDTAEPPLGRCVIASARLSHMIGVAWGLPMADLAGGPDWATRGFDRWDVQAKADDPAHATEAQLLQMLQALLVHRFQLHYHRETVLRNGFALQVGKAAPRLKRPTPDEVTNFGTNAKPVPGQPMTLDARKYTMERLANLIAFVLQQPVVDKTGLAGEYDFTLSWDETNGPTLNTALQEQLGLKLEPQKVPVSLFVIDSAQKPSAN